jgi:hypothetical protein
LAEKAGVPMAAEHGHAGSQFNLGFMNRLQKGKDYREKLNPKTQ